MTQQLANDGLGSPSLEHASVDKEVLFLNLHMYFNINAFIKSWQLSNLTLDRYDKKEL